MANVHFLSESGFFCLLHTPFECEWNETYLWFKLIKMHVIASSNDILKFYFNDLKIEALSTLLVPWFSTVSYIGIDEVSKEQFFTFDPSKILKTPLML